MSQHEMPPYKFKEAMNKQEAYKLLFKRHVTMNYSPRQAILECHRIIGQQSPEDIQAIIDGQKVITIAPKPNAGAGPMVPSLEEVMKEIRKDASNTRSSRVIESDCSQKPFIGLNLDN